MMISNIQTKFKLLFKDAANNQRTIIALNTRARIQNECKTTTIRNRK